MDESKKAVKGFLGWLLVGFAVYIPVCCAVSLIARRFSLSVALGAIYGSAVMMLYYFLFARTISRLADNPDADAVKKQIHASYSLRMFLLVILIGLGLLFATDLAPVKIFSWLPIIISIIVPRITIAVWQLCAPKSNGQEKEGDGIGD